MKKRWYWFREQRPVTRKMGIYRLISWQWRQQVNQAKGIICITNSRTRNIRSLNIIHFHVRQYIVNFNHLLLPIVDEFCSQESWLLTQDNVLFHNIIRIYSFLFKKSLHFVYRIVRLFACFIPYKHML